MWMIGWYDEILIREGGLGTPGAPSSPAQRQIAYNITIDMLGYPDVVSIKYIFRTKQNRREVTKGYCFEEILKYLRRNQSLCPFSSGSNQTENKCKSSINSGKSEKWPSVIILSWGAQAQRKVWLPKGPPVGKLFQKTLRIFHCFSDFRIKIVKMMRSRVAIGLPLSIFRFT